MSRAGILLSLTALGVFASGLTAQTRPDFAGQWTVQTDSGALGQRGGARSAARGAGGGRGAGRGMRGGRGRTGDMGSGWGSTITITQDAARLTVEYVFFERRDMQPPLSFVYALDGSETKASVMMGRGIQVQTSTTAWDGDRLVITTSYPFIDPVNGEPMSERVVRTLSLESPTSLVVETLREGVLGGPPSTTRTVYRKS